MATLPQSIPCSEADKRHVFATLRACSCILSASWDERAQRVRYVVDLALLPSHRASTISQLEHDLLSAAQSLKDTLQKAISAHTKQDAPEWCRRPDVVRTSPSRESERAGRVRR